MLGGPQISSGAGGEPWLHIPSYPQPEWAGSTRNGIEACIGNYVARIRESTANLTLPGQLYEHMRLGMAEAEQPSVGEES
jgi:hypothetical protein